MTKRPKRERENRDYVSFSKRVIKAHGRRVGEDGDPEDLKDLLALESDLKSAADAGVLGLRRRGFTWQQIANAIGVARQAAHDRWAKMAKEESCENL